MMGRGRNGVDMGKERKGKEEWSVSEGSEGREMEGVVVVGMGKK